MLNNIGLIHLFYFSFYHKAAKKFLFFSTLTYQDHTNEQLASLADSCINHSFELFYKIPLILLYCEHFQNFAYFISLPKYR